MKRRRKPTNLPAKIRARIERLKKACERADRARSELRRSRFLTAVYARILLWARSKKSSEIAQILGCTSRAGAEELLEALMKATDAGDRRRRWKHTAALKYAMSEGVAPDRVAGFIRKNGGYNACAAKWTKLAAARSASPQKSSPRSPRGRRRIALDI